MNTQDKLDFLHKVINVDADGCFMTRAGYSMYIFPVKLEFDILEFLHEGKRYVVDVTLPEVSFEEF